MVSYPWKRDSALLPDNKSQATKKLEATEHQLMKNPKQAKAYDQQMVEMSEMEFPESCPKRNEKDSKAPFTKFSIRQY